MSDSEKKMVYRILDANFNRSREALRVLEEYYRFIEGNSKFSKKIKILRHSVADIASAVNQELLIKARNTDSDPLSLVTSKSELKRDNVCSVVQAGFKRAQEAFRVLEEYLKLTESPNLSDKAKELRFEMYSFEKQVVEKEINE